MPPMDFGVGHKILVANLGSTSFKYRLYDLRDPQPQRLSQGLPTEKLLARGGVERIGSSESKAFVEVAGDDTTPTVREDLTVHAPDHAVAVRLCLEQLSDPRRACLRDPAELSAIGFKAVHARGVTGVQRVDERVLTAMEDYNEVAPAHNPPYVRAMRLLARELPGIPLVAAFETGFHQTIAPGYGLYAVPRSWASEWDIRRHGFHGASHRYIATRTAELLQRQDLRIISCHLGGSSSLCAIRAGQSVATSMGMSPQTGLPQNNRVGDFDVFTLPALMRSSGKSLEELLDLLASQSGLLGLCGHNDLRDIESAASRGEQAALEALEVYITAVRHYLGAYLVALGGADVLVFTGGIGENSARIREGVCAHLEWFGIRLDRTLNEQGKASKVSRSSASSTYLRLEGEMAVHAEDSRVQVWIMPTNEELIVARQARDLLLGRSA